jgi:HK97 family phage major capsid protein
MNDTLWIGDAVKALDESGKVGGYLVRFGDAQSVDLVGDYFTPDTDFDVEAWPHKTRVYYNHGFDAQLKRRKLGTAELSRDDVGVWAEAQLQMRDEYERAIFEMAKEGKLGWSSGTAPHLVEREEDGSAKRILAWPLGLDASLTPTPAEWRNSARSIKSLESLLEAVTPEEPAATGSADAGDVTESDTESEAPQEEPVMEPEVKAAEVDYTAIINDAVKAALNAQPPVNRAPALNTLGLGEDGDGVKAFMHYLRTGDEGGVRALKAYNNTDMNVGTAADGGYAVPTPLYNQIIARRDEMSIAPALGMMAIPGKGLTVRVPIDGEDDVIFAAVSEAGTVTQDAPALSYKDFTLVKYGKTLNLSWELLRDEDANLQGFINNWIARGLAATENSVILTELRANGTAGLTLDAAAAVGYTEIPEMVGKLAPEYQANAKWIVNPATKAYVQGVANSASFLFSPGISNPGGMDSLWGYPLIQTTAASAIAASAKSLIFGNFEFVGYRRSTSLNVIRDPYTVATSGQMRLVYWFDYVVGVMQAEAIQYATHPSA